MKAPNIAKLFLLLLTASCFVSIDALFQHDPKRQTLVVRAFAPQSDEPSKPDRYVESEEEMEEDPSIETKIYSMTVESRIRSRFATTRIVSRVANPHSRSVRSAFTVRLPNSAFISNFSMLLDGRVIVGRVEETEEAKEVYEAAVRRGESAGLVDAVRRETNAFRISVTVAARAKVSFNLTYQQILERQHGLYKHTINIHPGQVVKEMTVDVFISEQEAISRVHVPRFGLKTGEKGNRELIALPSADNVAIVQAQKADESTAHVSFRPTPEDQGSDGMNAQLVVLYDVERGADGGELQVVNGYFVHFFAPTNIRPTPKHVVFILDNSGSMSGVKMQQTKDAMMLIMGELALGDSFNILSFSDSVRTWATRSRPVSEDSLREARAYVSELHAGGGTNIDAALRAGLAMRTLDEEETKPRMVIFLTDGQATAGETDGAAILSRVAELRGPRDSVHAIAFGADSDFPLLVRLADASNGLARKVYEDSDAELQLQSFYGEISKLLLTNVKVKYLNETILPDSLVNNADYNYYQGGEMMTVGKVNTTALEMRNSRGMEVEVIGTSAVGEESFRVICNPFPDHAPLPPTSAPLPPDSIGAHIERMWAYLSIKKLLSSSKYSVGEGSERRALRHKALKLALKYGFVTELTSMVVATSDGAEILERQESDENPSALALGQGQAYYLLQNAHIGAPGRMGAPAISKRMGSADASDVFDSPAGQSGPAAAVALPQRPPKLLPAPPPTCSRRRNEILLQKGDEMPGTCADPEPSIVSGSAVCGCRKDFVRHEGACIELSDCPTESLRCGGNETKSDGGCFVHCEGECGKVRWAAEALCPVLCDAILCHCNAGYVKSPEGGCVLPRDCPDAPKSCGPNEELSECPLECPHQDCAHWPNLPTCRLRADKCPPPKCICQTGFIRDQSGACVLPAQCMKCGPNEILSQCGNRCDQRCSQVLGGPVPCPMICDPPACACALGHFRNDAGDCVPLTQCDVCPEREHLVSCVTAEPEPRCDTSEAHVPYAAVACSDPGCACDASFFRHANGSCVESCAEDRRPKRMDLGVVEVVELPQLELVVCGEGQCVDEPADVGQVCEESPTLERVNCEAGLRWHYDRGLDACVAFSFKGCGGNSNRFRTRSDCMNRCGLRDKVCAGGPDIWSGDTPRPKTAEVEEEDAGEESENVTQPILAPMRRYCEDDSCPSGWDCHNGPWTLACCNATIQSWFAGAYSPTCQNAAASYQVADGSSDVPRLATLYSRSCDLIQCPSGYSCMEQNQLFVACCKDDGEQLPATTADELPMTTAAPEEEDSDREDELNDCDDNEEWSDCPPMNTECDTTCANRHDRPMCAALCGEPRCVCKEGFVLYDAKCVTEDDCPSDEELQVVEASREQEDTDADGAVSAASAMFADSPKWQTEKDGEDSLDDEFVIIERNNDKCDGPGERWMLDENDCRQCYLSTNPGHGGACPKCPGHVAVGSINARSGCLSCPISPHDTSRDIYSLRVEVSSSLPTPTILCVDYPVSGQHVTFFKEHEKMVSGRWVIVNDGGQRLVSVTSVQRNATSAAYAHVRARELGNCGSGKGSGKFLRDLQLRFPGPARSQHFLSLEEQQQEILQGGIFGSAIAALASAEVQVEDPEAMGEVREAELILPEGPRRVRRRALHLVRRFDHVRQAPYACFPVPYAFLNNAIKALRK